MPKPSPTTKSKSDTAAPKVPAWHARPEEEVLQHFDSTPDGLTTKEAAQRLEEHGPNRIERTGGDTALQLLWRQINNPLIWVLLASGVLAIVMGKVTDGIVVLGVVILNTIIGFVQEYRAGKAIESLSAMVSEDATVMRDGSRTTIPAIDIVPGDIVFLQSGDKVPADIRIIKSRSLQIEEAALTGESVPAEKDPKLVEETAALGDRRNMGYSSSLVTYGTGTGVVVATGQHTELGRISSLLSEAIEVQTPLTRSLAKVGKYLTIAILIVAAAMFGIGLWRGYSVVDATLAAITLAVAAIPEGLPAIITIALAIGVQRMARRNAIIRRLPAVETLGSTTVICSDKTGTLTRNEMTVQEIWVPAGRFHLTGIGYEPSGELVAADDNDSSADDDATAQARELLMAGLFCNDSTLIQEENQWKIQGDPTEGALLVAAQKAGIDAAQTRNETKRLDAIPFESERQFMATLNARGDGEQVVYIKGAPEAIFSRCTHLAGGGEMDHDALAAQVKRMASEGMRVLAFASKPFPENHPDLRDEHTESDMALLGLQGMIDPPRPEAVEAIKTCHRAGIQVKMITGDHRETAAAIGREVGIQQEGAEAVTGNQLADMDDDQISQTVAKSNVFARVAPEHKLRLVRSLQKSENVVAMTGDGVNDSPALKQSDIGVAMGITGTAVSKEAADIVLADDNFASIAAAVEEGRRVYDNLVKSLAFVLPTNLGEALILLVAVLFFPIIDGMPLLPMMPTQILWINLVATVALALPLAFEAMEPNVMQRPPRDPNEPIMNRFVVVRTILVALLMTAAAIGLFLHEFYQEYENLERAGNVTEQTYARAYAVAQTMAVTTVIFFQIFYLLNCRSLRDSVFRIGLFTNNYIYLGIAALLILQAAFIYLPFMNRVFDSAPLPPLELFKSMALGLLILPIISIEKAFRNRKR